MDFKYDMFTLVFLVLDTWEKIVERLKQFRKIFATTLISPCKCTLLLKSHYFMFCFSLWIIGKNDFVTSLFHFTGRKFEPIIHIHIYTYSHAYVECMASIFNFCPTYMWWHSQTFKKRRIFFAEHDSTSINWNWCERVHCIRVCERSCFHWFLVLAIDDFTNVPYISTHLCCVPI